ncbi:Hypothetical predicted protein [Cloeon dipterum]|uniref:Myb-like domain-containing protein n=1 Tax=Cloeon dipterum TaxID=197152 RepID=A0A8S1CWG4_9INSE|nr:Hypothetical predicted protein [Cloeon dipterum]
MFRLHIKPVLSKPKSTAKQRADKAKGSPAKVSTPAEPKPSNPPAEESDVPSEPELPTEPADNAAPAVEPGRTRTLSYRSQDESASSADESRKCKVVPWFAKARIKPYVPGVKKNSVKAVSAEPPAPLVKVVPPPAPAVEVPADVAEIAEAKVVKPSLPTTPVPVRTGPSAHLVPAAPNCVPSNEENSSSEDEGVIDPYNPDHPLGHRENPEKCRGTKSPWVMKKFRAGPPIAMIDYLFYNPKTNPMVYEEDETVITTANKVEEEEDVDDPEDDGGHKIAAPQLKMGPDGNFIIDDKSLVVESSTAREGRKALQSNTVSGNKRRYNRSTWTNEETLFFYKCLNTIGTDFATMSRFFPNRNRHQIKLKFKLEEKRNLSLVEKALSMNVKYDVSELELEFQNVCENAAKQRAQKRKPKEAKPKEKKTREKRPTRSRKNRKDYVYEGGSASDECSSSDDENNSKLRAEMNNSMAEDVKKAQKSDKKSQSSERFAFVEVVPNTSAVAPQPLNPNALSGSQVSQLIGQRADKEQLRYGNSELAFLLNSPTIREKENERKQRTPPSKCAAVRRIALEDEQQAAPPAAPETPLREEHMVVHQLIRDMIDKRMEERDKQAEQDETMEVTPQIESQPEGEEERNSGDDDEMECIAQSFSKPTKSGRMPKLRNLNSAGEEDEVVKPKRVRKVPMKITKKRKSRSKSKEIVAEPEEPAEAEEDEESEDGEGVTTVSSENIPNFIANVEPGSIVVIKTAVPNEPDKEVLQVFMVPPANHSGTTVAHNPDGSVSQVTMGGTNVPLVPGTMISPATLVPIVAASSGSAVVHNLAKPTAPEEVDLTQHLPS